MDHAAAVGVVEGFGDLSDDVDGAGGGHGGVVQGGVGVGAVDVLHGDPGQSVAGGAAAVDGDDVGVAEGGGDVGFTLEAFTEAGIGDQLGVDDLEGVVAGQVGVAGQIHRAHASGADHPVDEVSVDKGPVVQHAGHHNGEP